jgi:thiamine phosphate synthase YjbQ (UPF0047 family)
MTDNIRKDRQMQFAQRIVTVFIQHTSCSVIIMENADQPRGATEEFFNRLVPEDASILRTARKAR